MKKQTHLFKTFFIIILLTCSGLYACQGENEIRAKIKRNTGIEIPDKFEELSSKTNSAVGDFSEVIDLKFDSVSFNILIKEVLNSPYYTNIFTDKPEIGNRTLKGEKKWYNRTNGYKFEYNIKGFGEFIECYIDTNRRIMRYQYIQE